MTANLAPELLAILRCPTTGAALTQEGSELVSTAGTTAVGQRAGTADEPPRYTIEAGIPVLLPASLLSAAAAAGSDQHDGPSTTVTTTKK